ncbi:Na+/H+ antiporter [Chitinophaga sp. GCM10012297]|uniref:Na+/H+ antiporter n=1 Tax=Chitinophaga chungangae TaxID=2821488 RepID=A0ABS3YHY9_9BACT|nr:Na+/H+ antiporter [Chitinophaga chungangae]MBO9154306.1 Na+/H+ antiporter [Chitinophaga chungangae]
MNNYSIVLFILAIMTGLSVVAEKIKLAAPILLIVAGIAIGFFPGLPEIEINPEIVLLIFLPPLLYDAAFNIDFKTFKTNINTISTLAIGLVFVTACGIAVAGYYLIPGMTWPLAFVLGAILSATDAVAAISITKGLGLSHNTITIIEGESLINDASALVAYRFAVAAVAGASFVIWDALLVFAGLLAGGALVGIVMGKILGFVLRAVRDNHLAVMSFMLLAPFVTYLLAEELHVSGVIAVVMLGLNMSRLSNQRFPEHIRNQSKNIWETIIFLLNGFIFILIGLEFPIVARAIDDSQIWNYVGYALLITIAALLLRMGRMFMQQVNLQRAFTAKKRRITEAALLTLEESMIISWSGMRGIVSLAIAIGLPRTLKNGEPFPMRNEIIFISTVAVLLTIIGQGITLPWIVRKMQAGNKKPAKL